MGVAALVLGIISLLIAWIPCVGWFALIPAIIGLVLGIVDTVQKGKKGEKRGISIAGLVLSAIALVILIAYMILAGIGIAVVNKAAEETDWNEVANGLNSWAAELNNIDWNTYDYNSILD